MSLIDSGAALFAGSSAEFTDMAPSSRLTAHITDAFNARWGRASESEIRSWRNSLSALAGIVKSVGLADSGVGVELKLPLTDRRIDAFFTGRDPGRRPSVVLVELKQWESAAPSIFPDNVVVGGRELLHPSVQAASYAEYLRSSHSAFTEDGFALVPCAYLHNMPTAHATSLRGVAYYGAIREAPFYVAGEEAEIGSILSQQIGRGDGMALLPRVVHGRYSPSMKLIDAIGRSLKESSVWTLLDEQRLAFNIVRGLAERAAASGEKGVLVVTGGPGTGKSVIAAHLLVKLSQAGGYRVVHATGSKAFTTNLRALAPSGGAAAFRYFNNFREVETEENALDVLLCDEAHRIRKSSNDRFTPLRKKSTIPQVDELIRAARVSVFFLDQRQNVRPDEVGTAEVIREAATRRGIAMQELALDAQFRCNGCRGYIEWVDRLMSPEPVKAGGWLAAGDYDLLAFDRPELMESALLERLSGGNTGRIVAGFCWPWSDPKTDGSLSEDVVIDDWRRPWNEKAPDQWKKAGPAPLPSRHPYTLWANRPERVREVGCIYSAQGFEFDYCAVILGNDLVWREGQGWVASRDASHDAAIKRRKMDQADLRALLQHTYRVLLTRGMKGTLIYSTDWETRAMLKGLLG
jgi:DUF2075 family protein